MMTGQSHTLKRYLINLTCLVSLLLCQLPCLAEETIGIIQTGERVDLNPLSEFLVTDQKQASHEALFEEYLNKPELWTPSHLKSKQHLFTYKFIWKKAQLKNPTPRALELFLTFTEAGTQHAEFYILRDNKVVYYWNVGNHKPFAERPTEHRHFVLPFSMQANEQLTVIWGVSSINSYTPVEIEEQKSFWKNDSKTLLGDGLYYGASIIICLLILFLYISDREKSYLFLFLMVLGKALHNFCRDGYAYQYLWPNTPDILSTIVFSTVNISTIGGILFTSHYLELKSRGFTKLYYLSSLYLAFNLLIVPITIFFPRESAIILSGVNTLLMIVYFSTMWVHSIKRSQYNDSKAKFYTVAWLLFTAPYIVYICHLLLTSSTELPIWIDPRNGELLLAMAFFISLIIEIKNSQISKQELIAETRAQTNFVATLSHELRTPLNGVIGMAQLLHQTEQTPTQKQYSNIIISSGNILLTLINDILDLTKITEGKLLLEKKHFHLDKMITDCTSTFLPLMKEKRLPLITRIAPQTPINLIGDQYRLRQVIFNLLSNAMKFTEKGSVKINIDCKENNNSNEAELHIQVIDTGIGIDKKNISKIFSAFSQEDASTTRKFGGSGLGLAITSSIIHAMGGKITASSELHQGSIFTVTIPITIDRNAEAARKNTLAVFKNKKLLILTTRQAEFDNIAIHFQHWGANITYDNADNINDTNHLANTEHYDALIAFYDQDPCNLLEQLTIHSLPLIIFHLQDIELNLIEKMWRGKLATILVPCPLQSMLDTMVELFHHKQKSTEINISEDLSSKFKGKSILVVEDNTTNQLVASGLLKKLGINTDLADNGEIALARHQENHYPLILMDCEMPVMDGFTASKKILELNHHPKPIIIALTAHVLGDIEQRCINAGMNQTLHKPITLAELKKCLSQISLNS